MAARLADLCRDRAGGDRLQRAGASWREAAACCERCRSSPRHRVALVRPDHGHSALPHGPVLRTGRGGLLVLRDRSDLPQRACRIAHGAALLDPDGPRRHRGRVHGQRHRKTWPAPDPRPAAHSARGRGRPAGCGARPAHGNRRIRDPLRRQLHGDVRAARRLELPGDRDDIIVVGHSLGAFTALQPSRSRGCVD